MFKPFATIALGDIVTVECENMEDAQGFVCKDNFHDCCSKCRRSLCESHYSGIRMPIDSILAHLINCICVIIGEHNCLCFEADCANKSVGRCMKCRQITCDTHATHHSCEAITIIGPTIEEAGMATVKCAHPGCNVYNTASDFDVVYNLCKLHLEGLDDNATSDAINAGGLLLVNASMELESQDYESQDPHYDLPTDQDPHHELPTESTETNVLSASKDEGNDGSPKRSLRSDDSENDKGYRIDGTDQTTMRITIRTAFKIDVDHFRYVDLSSLKNTLTLFTFYESAALKEMAANDIIFFYYDVFSACYNKRSQTYIVSDVVYMSKKDSSLHLVVYVCRLVKHQIIFVYN